MVNVDATQPLGQPPSPAPTPAKGRASETVRDAWARSGVLAPKSTTKTTTETAASRADAIHDTVTLSEGGHKIVNLSRGQELAKQIRTAPADENFSATLRKASQDIFRITRLFGETLKASFTFRR